MKYPLIVLLFVVLSFDLAAQPPWGDGPPPWMQRQNDMPPGAGGGDRSRQFGPPQQRRSDVLPGARGGDRSRQFGPPQQDQNDQNRNTRRIGMLKAMDTNQNGVLEPAEIPEYRRQMVDRVVAELGANPQGTINLNDLERRAAVPATPTNGAESRPTTALQPTGDPLVPPFGEKPEVQNPVLQFGQREPKAVISVARVAAPEMSSADQTLKQARELLAQFDKNGNGTLDKDKGEWSGALPFKAEQADKNFDGRISLSEILTALGGKATSASGSAVTATKQSAAYDRLPAGVPVWFFERDKDEDGQLTMIEYVNGQSWTKALADEFKFIDKNNDGLATVDEIFAVLKQYDEQKVQEADKAKREAARRGQNPQPATPAGEQPALPNDKPPEPSADPQNTNVVVPAPPPSAPYSSGSQTTPNIPNNTQRDSSNRSRRGR